MIQRYEKEDEPEWSSEQKLWRLLGFFFIQMGVWMTQGRVPPVLRGIAEEIRQEARDHW